MKFKTYGSGISQIKAHAKGLKIMANHTNSWYLFLNKLSDKALTFSVLMEKAEVFCLFSLIQKLPKGIRMVLQLILYLRILRIKIVPNNDASGKKLSWESQRSSLTVFHANSWFLSRSLLWSINGNVYIFL